MGVNVDMDKIKRVYDDVLEVGQIYLYVVNDEIVGVYGGYKAEPIMSNEMFFAEAFFVCTKPSYYPKLIKAVQNAIDCDRMLIVHMAHTPRLAQLYNKMGFKEMERQYLWTRKKS